RSPAGSAICPTSIACFAGYTPRRPPPYAGRRAPERRSARPTRCRAAPAPRRAARSAAEACHWRVLGGEPVTTSPVAAHDDAVNRHHPPDRKPQRLARIELLEPQHARVACDKALDVGVRRLAVLDRDLRDDEVAAPYRQARIDGHRLAGEIARLHRVADH